MPTIEGARFRGGTQDVAGSSTQPLVTITSPSAPGAGFGAGLVGKGGVCVALDTGKHYINNGTLAAPTWGLVTSA